MLLVVFVASFALAQGAADKRRSGYQDMGEALQKMQPGEASPVLRSPAGFHILKLLDRRVAGISDAPVAQTKLRHILIRTNEAVSESEARRKLETLIRSFEDETQAYTSLNLPMWTNRYGSYDDLARIKEWSAAGGLGLPEW